VGVAPRGFRFPRNSAIWILLPKITFRADRRTSAIARLRSGITIDAAQQDFDRVGRRLQHDYSETNRDVLPVLERVRKPQVAAIRPYVMLLSAAAALVLLVCGSNLSNLLLIRANNRAREFAIRLALGAVRSRLVVQLLVESTMVAFAGGLAGVASAWALLRAFPRFIPLDLPYWMTFGLDGHVLATSCVVAIGTALVFGTVPALHASRMNLRTALEEGGRASASSRYRRLMVACQVSLTFVLVVSATLMLESLRYLRQTNPGFRTENVMTFAASPYRHGSFRQANAGRIQYFKELASRLEQLPHVVAVGVTSSLPYDLDQTARGLPNYNVEVKEGTSSVAAHRLPASVVDVMPSYFAALGIPLLQGRAFTDRDASNSPRVVVLSERAAAVLFPGGNAIGHAIRQNTSGNADPWATVVGVVGNVRYSPEDADTSVEIYAPLAQWEADTDHVIVYFDQLGRNAASLLRAAAADVDRGTAADDIEPMTRVVEDAVWQQRLWGLGLGALAAIGCVLSAIALYVLIAYDVSAHRRDFGIRAALGASPIALYRQVIGDSLAVIGIGTGVGVVIAVIGARIMSRVLYRVAPLDPIVFALSAVLLLIVSLAAASIPGLRAGTSNPAKLLADIAPARD
jgi:putative ABC transport system permease protein